MPDSTVTTPEGAVLLRNSTVQYGIVRKRLQGSMTIKFNVPFPVVPVVVISPYLQVGHGQPGMQVPNVETINDTETDRFTIFSDNGGDNYFVTWIAIGHPPTP
jgi:hypothetical protein